ncbi:MAG TPA: hypothetical protein VFQ53_15790 [Kofleriaceae bacterium]|nr:hypothetical protein [Kofleriaceae bacterium]
MIARLTCLATVLASSLVWAQAPRPNTPPSPPSPPPPSPPPVTATPAPPPPPLAQIKDDKQLAEVLSSITQDPAVPVDDPAKRPLAQALMIEGVKQLQAKAFDQALANFLEAYAKIPSPKILLNIASTLRDMGRLADAANTYQRYLSDPATGSERVAEVKELLLRLDEQLTILTVRVSPHGSYVSVDAGPFIPVGSTLMTRVRPGLHLVRVRKEDDANELTVNGFEGENKEVLATVEPKQSDVKITDAKKVKDPKLPAETPKPKVVEPAKPPPEHQEGWLITGQYGSDGTGRERKVLSSYAGAPVEAIVPAFEVLDSGDVVIQRPRETIASGVVGVVRIDAEGRGFAGGIGFAIARGRFEGDIMLLRSEQTGGYLGFRYRLFTGFFRPYAAVGIPGFVFDSTTETAGMTTTEKKLAIGARAAAGLELYINGHLSVHGDVGFEHFWFTEKPFVDNVVVPSVGAIVRM